MFTKMEALGNYQRERVAGLEQLPVSIWSILSKPGCFSLTLLSTKVLLTSCRRYLKDANLLNNYMKLQAYTTSARRSISSDLMGLAGRSRNLLEEPKRTLRAVTMSFMPGQSGQERAGQSVKPPCKLLMISYSSALTRFSVRSNATGTRVKNWGNWKLKKSTIC